MSGGAPDPVKRIWGEQGSDMAPMTLAAVRTRARLLDEGGRRRRIIGYTAGAVTIVGYGYASMRFPNWIAVAGGLLVILGVINLMYQTYANATPPVPRELGELPSAEFYRARLVRQCDHARTRWRRVMLPLIPGSAIVLVGLAIGRRSSWLFLVPIAAAGAYVFVRVWTLDRACVRAHERDLEALDRMEDR